MFRSYIKKKESDREVLVMSNRLRKLKKDIEKEEKSIKRIRDQQDSFRKTRDLFNKNLQLKLSEKKKRMEILHKENERIKQLYKFRYQCLLNSIEETTIKA